jgi:hypothetical protein
MTDFLQKTGAPQICFADHANDFAPATGNSLEQGTPTDVEMQMASVTDGAACQSDQVDLGASRPQKFDVSACLEFAATPNAGDIVELYWAPSPDGTAANGNPGGVSGSKGAYTGDSSNLAAAVKQLQYIGPFICTEVATSEDVQIANVGVLKPKHRYGTLVMKDESGANMHSDDVEMHIVFDPIVDTA